MFAYLGTFSTSTFILFENLSSCMVVEDYMVIREIRVLDITDVLDLLIKSTELNKHNYRAYSNFLTFILLVYFQTGLLLRERNLVSRISVQA